MRCLPSKDGSPLGSFLQHQDPDSTQEGSGEPEFKGPTSRTWASVGVLLGGSRTRVQLGCPADLANRFTLPRKCLCFPPQPQLGTKGRGSGRWAQVTINAQGAFSFLSH